MVEKKVAIVGGTLIDGTGRQPLEDAVVVVDGSKIAEVGSRSEVTIPDACRRIDASGLTIMPGLMDIHMHLSGARSRLGGPIPLEITWALETNFLKCIRAAVDAWKILDQGITTVSDVGSFFGPPLRIAIEEGTMIGPRIIPCGRCLTGTGGNGDLRRDRVKLPDQFIQESNPMTIAISGVNGAREAVRALFREGADMIKIVGTATFSMEEMKAIVDQARRLGGKVRVHADGPQQVKDAVKLDVDIIEHSAAVFNEKALRTMVEKNIFLVPTLALRLVDWEKWFPPFENRYPPAPTQYAQTEEYYKKVDEGVKRAHELGVKIACGSDAWCEPITPFVSYSIMEVKFLADALSPMDAIVSATKTSAEALGIEENVGTIERGKLADIILVKGNPLKDINVLTDKNNIKRIMKEGKMMMRFGEGPPKSFRITKPMTRW